MSKRARKAERPCPCGVWAAVTDQGLKEAAFDRAYPRTNAKVGEVYFVGPADGPVKIGTAVAVESRLRELQVGSPVKLELLARMPGGRHTEAALHRAFAAFRLHGEWFRREPELVTFLNLLNGAL